MQLIGRQPAIAELERAYVSPRSALVSVVGRRRVGKTFLVNEAYAERIAFAVTGLQGASKTDQLRNFGLQLATTFGGDAREHAHADWLPALAALAEHLDKLLAADPVRRVVFFDELPWLASRKSKFLMAFGWFWNSWAASRRVVVVICGSAASWMIGKIIRAKGSLHNRITHRIALYPFTLAETEAFLRTAGVSLDRYQIALLYMATGGVPFYLEQVRAGESAAQAIDRLLFRSSGPLRGEFDVLYAALFDNAAAHTAIVRALAANTGGLTRTEVLAKAGLPTGGTSTRYLEELVLSGFVAASPPFAGKKRNLLYRLIDEYSAFYLKFVEGAVAVGAGHFLQVAATPSYRSWAGLAFERLAMRHVDQLKAALGIAAVYTQVASYVARGSDERPGVQIDLLIDRADRAISLVEAKFYDEEYVVTKAYAEQLRRKRGRFREYTGTKKQLFWVLLTAFGLRQNRHSTGLVDTVLTLDALFGD